MDACPWTQLETSTGQMRPESSMDTQADKEATRHSSFISEWEDLVSSSFLLLSRTVQIT